MATQQLVYENVAPVNSVRHKGWSVEVGSDYSFAKKVNSMPLMAVEIPFAAADYAVVFAGNEQAVMPAVILGVRSNDNLFIKADGSWDARYVPAFARRYPFVFSSSDDGGTFTLCIDEAFSGFNQAGKGAPLFEEEGKASPYVQNVLNFLQEYQSQFLRTQSFCKTIQESGLLEPMQAQITTPGGEKLSLSGFMAVNRDKLKALSPEKLAILAKTDELELIYLHVNSMRNFQGMIDRLGKTESAGGKAASESAPA
jgi:hypothetical protein